MAGNSTPKPDKYQVVDPDYKGVELGQPPRVRDKRNRQRVTPGGDRAILDERAGDYFGLE